MWGLPRVTPGAAGLFGIYLDMAYNVASANLSSPQTTEMFAGARADTLWKHVKRADAQVAVYGVLGALVANAEQAGAWVWPVAGATIAGVIMHASYAVALRDGLEAAGRADMTARGALWGRG